MAATQDNEKQKCSQNENVQRKNTPKHKKNRLRENVQKCAEMCKWPPKVCKRKSVFRSKHCENIQKKVTENVQKCAEMCRNVHGRFRIFLLDFISFSINSKGFVATTQSCT